jgi:hypothetical protein
VNALALLGTELGGVVLAIDRFGPPLATAIAVPLGVWIEPAAIPADPLAVAVRSVAWAVAAVSLLVVVFRRVEVVDA